MNFELKENVIPCLNDLVALYNDVGWSNYTNNTNMLQKAYDNSLLIITAWCDDKLLGAIRIVGDGFSIIYVQDIVVLRAYQHMGIGSKLSFLYKVYDVKFSEQSVFSLLTFKQKINN